MATKPVMPLEAIDIPAIKIEGLQIPIIGDSPLIMHKWSEKAKKMMLDKQMKIANSGREAKDPEQDYKDSIYHDSDGNYAFPAMAFKTAIVSACRFTDGIKMTVIRGAVHVEGEFVKINGKPTPREDMVRIGMGVADIRYRAEFREWSANVRVAYNRQVLSKEQVVNLFSLAGFGVGIGEWRPEKNGQYGRFHVGNDNDVKRRRK